MKFEKQSFLMFTNSAFLVLLTTTSLQAVEKLDSLDAFWNSIEISNNVIKKTQAPLPKLKPTKYTRKQYQARFKHEQALKNKREKQKIAATKSIQKNKSVSPTKLDRQRAIWRKKWYAQQKAKKRETAVHVTKPIANKRQLALKNSRPLTQAQYIQRWKRTQAKKHIQPNTRPTHASFRKSNQKASFQRLPLDIAAKLRSTGTREDGVSAYVQDVNSPKPLLAYRENTARVPASVMKIITGYAALGTLGPNYRWPLDVFTDGRVHNGTLQGDLIIKGYGSPEFKTTDLRKILQGIKQKGIRNINGRIVFDSSYFNIPNQYSYDGKTQSKYNALPDALLFNERINTFQVRTVGKKVKVTTTTPTHNLKIVNKMRKSNRSCNPRIKISKRAGQTIATFTGRFSRRCGTRSYSRVISRPAEMIYGTMQAMWKREVGGTLNTRFAMGRKSANARPLLRTYSRTLAEILPTIIKNSNNVMARQLLLTIGAKKSGFGTPRAGANAIGQWLASRGLHFPELRIENGSGLSRTARISASHVGDLLVDAYRSPYRNIFMQSLAVAGVDGTMKGRLKHTQVRGRGFFKTGTLRDVRSIAGYVKAANGKTYVMAILHNDPRAKKRTLRAHDKLIEWVYAGGRSNRRVAMR